MFVHWIQNGSLHWQMSLEENARTPHMQIQANQGKKVSMQTIPSGTLEWLTAELLNSEVEEKTSASTFSSTKEPREP